MSDDAEILMVVPSRIDGPKPPLHGWRPASDPPECEEGGIVIVIVATEKRRVCAAFYLNRFMLLVRDAQSESYQENLGFFERCIGTYGDQFYVPIPNVELWHPLPELPEESK